MNRPNLKDISLQELRDMLEAEVKEMRIAHKRFNEMKLQLELNFRKIDVAIMKVDDSTSFDANLMQKKMEIWAKIEKVRAHTERIKEATMTLSTDFVTFSQKFMDVTVTAKEIEILKNLGATEEEIREFLMNYAPDEDYNEIRMNYNEMKLKAMEARGEISSEMAADDEVSFDFYPGLM